MIDLCQWRARIGSWNCSRHWTQPSTCTSTGSSLYCGTGRASAGDTAQEKGPGLFLSIFCLLILLFISGDVELNPGPTLTDKPTRDELVELLSSSKFTAGTWEQFVCCLPNMTQDIITGIKERGSVKENTMSAVAQHCLDNNPDITWRKVINALLDADEVTIARNVLDDYSGTSSSKSVCRTVKQVLRSHYSKLMETTETCLLKVASELYSKKLINKEVRHSPTFEKIEIDFSAMVSLYKGDAKKMMEVCSLFIDCLSTAGGPAQEEAIALARDWESEVFKDHQVSFSFTKAITKYTPQEVKLSYNDSLAVELRNLSKKYVILIDDITMHYASSGKHDPIVIARWVQNTFYETGLARVGVTVDEIFERMLPHHSFIDINAINDLMEANPVDDSVLQARFDEYSDNIDNFIDSVELNDIVKTIEAVIVGESTKVDPKVILKLSGRWNERTIGHVHKLMNYLFDKEAKYVTIKKFLRGSISIQFLVFSRSVQPLIVKSQTKIPFLHLLGILQLIIDNQTIIDREEDIGFTFEESLLHSIASIDSDIEYHRLSLLLIKLKINLNYQNTDDQTALKLASEGGNIEIFKSLLQNGANPCVQLPANKGYIGLNRLACTALSQHIYKSIGGERIVPQDDTSVEYMLEMAVKERGVSIHKFLYSPFMHIVKNYFKERFQWLQNCFHTLNSNFIDAATNILTSKALVTEAKQHFQPYIKEDATCENAHQLLQLLQPHYSCLNINLLTIPCTITEPIKEQVEEYNTNLKIFKDTTSLLELAMMTKGMHCPEADGVGCSKIVLKLDKSWCSRTIAELNKVENFNLSSFLTLLEIHRSAFNLMCSYLIPQLYIKALWETVFEKQGIFLYKIGILEIMIGDVSISMMENEDKPIEIETALLDIPQNYLPDVIFGDQNDVNTRLIAASAEGDFLTVEFLLNQDPDINFQDDEWTALMIASRNGHHQVVELLLSKNPDINIQRNNGINALMFASVHGHHQVVELLLSKDPDINIRNSLKGDTALIAASRFGRDQVVKVLLSKDPDINIKNNDGWTALFAASVSGHHKVVELLLSKDPNINIQSNVGESALMAAGCYGHHQVVELLLNKDPDVNSHDKNGATALMYASANGRHQVVKVLLSKDPDISIRNNNGKTALVVACANGHHQVVELLLSKDPDINIQDDDGKTALMGASANGHYQVVELLLSENADVNIKDKGGVTALMYASYFGHHKVVQLLLSKDPNINIQDNNGHSALTFTLVCSTKTFVTDGDIPLDNCTQLLNHNATLRFLLKSHPNHTHLVDGKEFHSLAVAALFNNFDAVTILVEKCAILPEHIINAFTAACYGGHSLMIIHLSEKIATLSNNERKLLVAAANGGLGTLISMIYEVGMSPDTPLVAGITPLMIAASCGHAELVDALIQAGVGVNKRNDEGMNALDIVNYIEHYDRSDIKELLITKTPTGEPDPVSKNDELTEKKSSTVTISIKSIFCTLKSYMTKAYNPTCAKQKEMKISSKSGDHIQQ